MSESNSNTPTTRPTTPILDKEELTRLQTNRRTRFVKFIYDEILVSINGSKNSFSFGYWVPKPVRDMDGLIRALEEKMPAVQFDVNCYKRKWCLGFFEDYYFELHATW